MKKFSALLLTGIIGTSMLFAGFAGSAAVEYKLVDLDDKSFTMENKTVIDADLELHADTAGAKGEGNIYAEINATLKVAIDTDESDANATKFTGANFEAKITDASVVGDGWKVSILGVNDPADFAADMINLNKKDEAYNYVAAYGVELKDGKNVNFTIADKVGGLAVTLDDYGTVSVGYNGNFDPNKIKNSTGFFALESTEVEVAENMKATVAGSVGVLNKNFKVGGSAKVAYARDGYSASLATDLGYDKAAGFGADVAMNSTSKYATVDAYYGTTNSNLKFTGVDNMLNVQVVSDLNEFAVPVELTLAGVDLINTQDLSAKADVTINKELSANVSGGYKISGSKKGDWKVGAGAEYAVEAYTAKLGAELAKGKMLSASASVESETLIDGATLSLAWADAKDLLQKDNSLNDDGTTKPNFGTITASCKIAF